MKLKSLSDLYQMVHDQTIEQYPGTPPPTTPVRFVRFKSNLREFYGNELGTKLFNMMMYNRVQDNNYGVPLKSWYRFQIVDSFGQIQQNLLLNTDKILLW